MKKLILSTFITILIASFLNAQECDALSMIQEGSKWELTNYDKKDKVEGSTTYHVKEVSSDGDAVVWKLSMDMKDKKGEVYNSTETDIRCEAGVFKMSMEQFMNNEQFQGMQEMDVEVDASDIEYPTAPEVGETLPDAQITIKASTNGITTMNITTKIVDRKIESAEEITTPAGTFDCLIVTQKSKMKFAFVDKEFPSKDWYLPGFGVVRSESYKSNGKLIGYSVLTSYEQ
tara:strand:+ start:631 stop:1323 length:693 start_codon:yes stop_codon:yes gene_type:complete